MQYNVTVIGSGPGGYVAAIRCAQLGFKTAIVEKYDTLGGTCLNVGCIPSKALLDSTEHFHNAAHTFKEHGIDIPEPKVNIKQMIARKSDVVKQNVDGIAFLMKKNKIDVLKGVGSFVDKNTIKVTAKDGKESSITTDNVIIATGSKPTALPFAPFDNRWWRCDWYGAWVSLCAHWVESFCGRIFRQPHSYDGRNHGQRIVEVHQKVGDGILPGPQGHSHRK